MKTARASANTVSTEHDQKRAAQSEEDAGWRPLLTYSRLDGSNYLPKRLGPLTTDDCTWADEPAGGHKRAESTQTGSTQHVFTRQRWPAGQSPEPPGQPTRPVHGSSVVQKPPPSATEVHPQDELPLQEVKFPQVSPAHVGFGFGVQVLLRQISPRGHSPSTWQQPGIGVWLQPPAASHPSVVQTSPSSQLIVVPAQTPPVQTSFSVHAFPSSQTVPSAAAGFEHAPVLGLHTPATWH